MKVLACSMAYYVGSQCEAIFFAFVCTRICNLEIVIEIGNTKDQH